MKYFFITITILFCALFSEAQTQSLKEKLQDAEYFYLNQDFEEALKIYKETLLYDPINFNVNYKIGICYQRMLFEAGRSIPYLEKAVKGMNANYIEGSISEKNAPLDAMYFLAYAYHTNKYYDKALDYYKMYLDTIPTSNIWEKQNTQRQYLSCQTAVELAKKPLPVEIYNVGNAINSIHNDINPCPTFDGKTIFFTRVIITKTPNKTGTENIITQTQKIFTSNFLGGEKWSNPIDITEQLQTGGNCSTVSVNGDGTYLILYRDDRNDGGLADIKGGSLYYSTRKYRTDPWGPIQKFGKNINTFNNETHAAISADGKKLYVSANPKGGFGGLDLYVSELIEGEWGPLKNLGPTVNTSYDEVSPFILDDGKTLYFSTEGHYNMGGFDVFKTTLIGDNQWSEPQNAGIPINSADDNIFFYPTLNGKKAFYALARHEGYFTFGGMDIYEMELLEQVEKEKILPVTLNGKISFDDNLEIDNTAKVYIVSQLNNDTVDTVKPTLEGEYTCMLDAGNYKVIFVRENYKNLEKTVSIPKTSVDKLITVNALMIPNSMDNKKYYVIRNIYFDLNSFELTREALFEADNIFSIMMENPSLFIEVIGHTDSYGSSAYNKKLSEKRSRKLINYLIEKGIEPKRFVSTAAGNSSKAVIDMANNGKIDEDKARLNRRVEIRIIKTAENAEITVDNRPNEVKFKEYNRFSILIIESPTRKDTSMFSKLGIKTRINEFEDKNGNFLYYYGDYKTKAEASVELNNCIKNGFATARLIDYFVLNDNSSFKVTNNTSSFSKKYTIQLQSIEKPLVLHVNPIMAQTTRYKTKDGYFRYTYKEFNTMEEAQVDLKKVIEAGFNDAVIIEVSKLQK